MHLGRLESFEVHFHVVRIHLEFELNEFGRFLVIVSVRRLRRLAIHGNSLHSRLVVGLQFGLHALLLRQLVRNLEYLNHQRFQLLRFFLKFFRGFVR